VIIKRRKPQGMGGRERGVGWSEVEEKSLTTTKGERSTLRTQAHGSLLERFTAPANSSTPRTKKNKVLAADHSQLWGGNFTAIHK